MCQCNRDPRCLAVLQVAQGCSVWQLDSSREQAMTQALCCGRRRSRLPLLPRLVVLVHRPAAGRVRSPEQVAHARLGSACKARHRKPATVAAPGLRWSYWSSCSGGAIADLCDQLRLSECMNYCVSVGSPDRHFRGGPAKWIMAA